MTSITLNTKYPLTVLSPYITIMVYSWGGDSDYLLEFGRVDERDYAVSKANKLFIIGRLLCVLIGIYVLIV